MLNKYFLVQIKRTNGTIEKGVVIKDDLDAAMNAYNKYLGAYANKGDANTDYVQVCVMDAEGFVKRGEVWELKQDAQNGNANE